MSGNSGATTGTDALIFGGESGPAGHVRVSTMRRQMALKILLQIIFEMTLPYPRAVNLAIDNVLT